MGGKPRSVEPNFDNGGIGVQYRSGNNSFRVGTTSGGITRSFTINKGSRSERRGSTSVDVIRNSYGTGGKIGISISTK